MKLRIFIIFVVLTFLSGGPQTLLGQEGATPDRGNTAPADMLPDELQGMDIKDYFVSADAREAGIIQTMTGHVAVIHEDSNQVYFAAPGDKIFEKDVIFTLKESRCRLKFLDDNLITMSENTNVGVKEFITDLELKEKKSVFSMVRGKAMFYALKLFKYRKSSILVETPTAVAGVRGTKFGVAVRTVKMRPVASKPVYLTDASGSGQIYLARANPSGTETIVYAFDGEIEVYSPVDKTTQRLQPGEKLALTETGAGMVNLTPLNEARQFESFTETPVTEGEETGEEDSGDTNEQDESDKTDDEESDEEESDDEQTDDSSGSIGDDGGLADTDTSDPSADVSQTQTEQEIDESSEENWEGMIAGAGSYVAAMITGASNDSGIAWNETNRDPMYISRNPSPFSGGAETHIAYENAHNNNDDYKMVIEEISDPAMDMKVTYFALNTGGNVVVVDNYFEWHQGGHYLDENGHEYLMWGWWDWVSGDASGKVGHDGTNVFYTAEGKIWEIEGKFTHADAITHLQQQNFTATYTGEAKGVYAQSDAANVDILSGIFSCHIDFGVKQISDFEINVNGAGVDVHLYGGSGVLNGDGTFQLNGSSFISAGSTIDGNPIAGVGENGANGACFGTNAQAVGGVWHAHDGADAWATGEFHGKR